MDFPITGRERVKKIKVKEDEIYILELNRTSISFEEASYFAKKWLKWEFYGTEFPLTYGEVDGEAIANAVIDNLPKFDVFRIGVFAMTGLGEVIESEFKEGIDLLTDEIYSEYFTRDLEDNEEE